MKEWIKIEDSLPEVMETVLCFSNNEVHTRIFSRSWSKLTLDEFKRLCPVTHWMPLPNPPSL